MTIQWPCRTITSAFVIAEAVACHRPNATDNPKARIPMAVKGVLSCSPLCLYSVIAALSLFFNQLALAPNHLPVSLAKVSAYRAICGYHTVARHLGRKRVTLQCLPHCLCAAAPNAPRQFAVCDGDSRGNVQQLHVHPPLERAYFCG